MATSEDCLLPQIQPQSEEHKNQNENEEKNQLTKKRKLLLPDNDDTNTNTTIPTHLLPLHAIIGDGVSLKTLEELWIHSKGSIERAVNSYFDGSFQKASILKQQYSDHAITDRTGRTETGRTAKNQAQPLYLGQILASGYSLTKKNTLISANDEVNIDLDKPTQKSFKKSNNASTAAAAIFSSSRKQKNSIVRFTTRRGYEIGRLPADVARFVAPLLEHKLCTFKGVVVFLPPRLRTGDDILLQIRAYFRPEAFSKTSRSSDAYLTEEQIESKTKILRLALFFLLKRCGNKPTLSGAVATRIFGNDAESDEALEAAFSESSSTTTKANAKEDGEEEGQNVSADDVALLYSRAQKLDAELPEKEPAVGFAFKLRPYQKQALSWMYTKETEDLGGYTRDSEDGDSASSRSRESLIHPLWEEYRFGSTEPGDAIDPESPDRWYFNPYSGEMSLTFPRSTDRSRGGILADEMGLGKTIEVLSLIHANPAPKESSTALAATPRTSTTAKKPIKATLVVCPMSLLAQWRDEAAAACPSLVCEVYYGNTRAQSLRDADVVITSYGTLMSEHASASTSSVGDQFRKHAMPPLFSVEFHRIVLDEAHQIKSRSTKTAKACYALEARRRWCVTGTPIQNKLEDLFSLIHFIRIEPWSTFSFWRAHITIPFEENKDVRALTTVQTVLEPVVLMRTKNMKDARGKSIVELPVKKIDVEYLDFSEAERDIYDSLFRDSKTKFNTYCAAGKVLSHFASIFQLLMRLRQVCDHPIIVLNARDASSSTPTSSSSSSHEIPSDGKVNLTDLIARFSRPETSDLDDISSSPTHSGGRSAAYAQTLLQRLLTHTDQSDGDGDGDGEKDRECAICFEPTMEPVLMPCLHTTCKSCVVGYLQRREEDGKPGECPICRHPVSESDLINVVRRKSKPAPVIARDPTSASSPSSSSSSDPSPLPLPPPELDLRRNTTFRSSTKLDALVSHLSRIRDENPRTRSVVFSQFTSMLDLVEVVLARNNISFRRLDGSMNQKSREEVLTAFKAQRGVEDEVDGSGGGSVVEVLLVSLRAGGVGLNLTSASEVFMMDPWWNFEIEKQAIDRVHRIGQTRPVNVHRFIIRGTVEEQMLKIQERKSALAGGALGLNKEEAKERRLEELMILFK